MRICVVSGLFNAKSMEVRRQVQNRSRNRNEISTAGGLAATTAPEESDEDSEVGESIGAFLDNFDSSGSDDGSDSGKDGGINRNDTESETGGLLPVTQWGHDACMRWLKALPAHAGVSVDIELLLRAFCTEGESPVTTDGTAGNKQRGGQLSGELLLQASQSTRELRDSFGLTTMQERLAFEAALALAQGPSSKAARASLHNADSDEGGYGKNGCRGAQSQSQLRSSSGGANTTEGNDSSRSSELALKVQGSQGGIYSGSFMDCVKPLVPVYVCAASNV